ncbi:MAG TPA: hypothetical protein V6D25_31015 [Leptolyngbyaceae cyanobacterium]
MSNLAKRSIQDIVLFGRQQNLKLQIIQAISTHRQIWNKDVGQIVGLPVVDAQRAKPQDRFMKILFKSRPKPPWRVNGEDPKSICYTIPNVKRGLTWEQIKLAAQPFNWGKYRATAFMSSRRQMAVYGATEEEAEKVLKLLATLSADTITNIHVSEDKSTNPQTMKISTRFYPCYATVISEPTDIQGLPRQGKKAYRRERRRLDLYREPLDKSALA